MKSILLKFSLIAACCFFSQISYGQTKEETIQWLNDYGTKLLDIRSTEKFNDAGERTYKSKFTGFDGIYLTFIFDYKEVRGNGSLKADEHTISKIEPQSILYQDISMIENDKKSFLLKAVPKSVKVEFVDVISSRKTEYESTNISVYYYDKQEDVKRVLKAILHLAKLSGAKPLPAVKKDTF